jgi:uncharacterized protein YyaL (SSP411 family)
MGERPNKNGGKNRLASEKSPYLLQHADNPVDWYPWGEEAFAAAKQLDRPIFLSIGYATCHWCHVMAHESFLSSEVAQILNENFISVKVDREERPDVDQVYMAACQALNRSGGWPLSAFLDYTGRPFFVGTYFPPKPRRGMPGFADLCLQIAALWKNDRPKLISAGSSIVRAIAPQADKAHELDMAVARRARQQLGRVFDPANGGFGTAPKFPTPHNLLFLVAFDQLAEAGRDTQALEMVEKTLEAMYRGGIWDQLGFGIHRYSVDEKWLVPHFEKMLYDQALVALAAIDAWTVIQKPFLKEMAYKIFTFVLGQMTDREGGFYCALDADSQGVEGLYYVWTPAQVKEILDSQNARLFCKYFRVSQEGNFENGWSILNAPLKIEDFARLEGMEVSAAQSLLEEARIKLLEARFLREPPMLDDKILTSWNGLMIAALARAAIVFDEPEYLAAANRAADFVFGRLTDENGLLLRRFRENQARHTGFLDDYAFFVWGLIELYQAGGNPAHLKKALALHKKSFELFGSESGGLYYTPSHGEALVARMQDAYDSALPSGNSVAAANGIRLARLVGDSSLEEQAVGIINAFGAVAAAQPTAFTHLLHTLVTSQGNLREVVLCGDPQQAGHKALAGVFSGRYPGGLSLLHCQPGEAGRALAQIAPFVEPMRKAADSPKAFVCQNNACLAPVDDARTLAQLLDDRQGQA